MGNSKAAGDRIRSKLYSVVDVFERNLSLILPEPHASLASGILLGVRASMPDELLAELQKTGLTHIIALSGFNVTIIITVLVGSLVVYIGRKKTFVAGFFLVCLFVIMTGAAPSIVRAAIFCFLILFGKTIGKRGDQTNLLLLTALIMILVNPYLLPFDMGFQLSFLAFAGIVYLSPHIFNLIEKRAQRLLPDIIKQPLSETLGAQFAVMPLILKKFGIISIVSPLANILIVWIVPWIMFLTFVSGILSLIFLPLGKMTVVLLWPSLEYMIRLIGILAKIPLSSITF